MRLRRLAAVGAAAATLATLPLAARGTTPTFFPTGQSLDTTTYSLRIQGDDRYNTAAALSRVAAVNASTLTGYPFNEADSTEQGKSYGFGNCPKTVGVAAGDTVADALAASSIKDIGLFPVGTGATATTIDTTGATMLLNPSGRENADDLAPQTRTALQEIKEACGSFEAIIFGGTGAISEGAETTLKALASKVVRVAGADRFDTAAQLADGVANSTGTPTVPIFTAFNTKTDNVNTVFLVEGLTGADALAVGPFAAAKNVPILLTTSEALPTATRNALLKLSPDTIIVLGGTGAVSEAVANEAAQASGGAQVRRISGADRHETSVQVARQLYNLFPYAPDTIPGTSTGDDDRHSNVGFGFARSEGSGAGHNGFPDALASAWFLDSFYDRAAPPERFAAPIERNVETAATAPATGTVNTLIGGQKAPFMPPLLLVRQGDATTAVADYVRGLYPETGQMRTARQPTQTNHGGFGFFFGGVGAIAPAVEQLLAQNLSGQTYVEADRTDLRTSADSTGVFFTKMDFTGYTSKDDGGVDEESFVAAGDKVCAIRKALGGTQFLSVYDDPETFAAAQKVDYQDGASFPQFESRFQCVDASGLAEDKGIALAIGPTGRKATGGAFDFSAEDKLLTTEAPGSDTAADTAGTADPTADPGITGGTAENEMTYSGTMTVVLGGTRYDSANFRLTLRVVRTSAQGNGPDRVTVPSGTLTLLNGTTTLFTATIKGGESSTVSSPLKISGMYESGPRRGGFRATITRTATIFSLSDLAVDGIA